MHIGFVLDQHPRNVSVFLRQCPHQSRVPLPGILGVYVRSAGEKRFHSPDIASARARHENGLSRPGSGVGVRPGLQQLVHHTGATVGAGQHERSGGIVISRIHVCPSSNEKVDRFQIIPVGRPAQRRCTVRLRSVHIDMLLKEGANGLFVPTLRRIHQPKIGGHDSAGEQQR